MTATPLTDHGAGSLGTDAPEFSREPVTRPPAADPAVDDVLLVVTRREVPDHVQTGDAAPFGSLVC